MSLACLRRKLPRGLSLLGLFTLVYVCIAVLASSGSAQTQHIVSASGFNFSPKNITIRQGDSVKWMNLQGNSHNVAQTDCPASINSTYNGGFWSGFGGDVPTFEVTFNEAGEFCYICEPHVLGGMNGHISVEPVWTDLGGGTAGINGAPTLTGEGPLTAGSILTLDLVDAAPSALILFWMSLAPLPFPALGGTVWAFPHNLQVLRFSNAAGSFSQSVPWPAGIPAGTEITMQFLIQDLSTSHEIVLSNGLVGETL